MIIARMKNIFIETLIIMGFWIGHCQLHVKLSTAISAYWQIIWIWIIQNSIQTFMTIIQNTEYLIWWKVLDQVFVIFHYVYYYEYHYCYYHKQQMIIMDLHLSQWMNHYSRLLLLITCQVLQQFEDQDN